MANPAADPKSALLAGDLREYALALPTTTFPKNFFCALCNELAIDSWKLLCCNKSICSTCQAKLQFPTTCPSCEHSPLEEESCSPNKALRNTMRVWLQKQKKKEEVKAVSQTATPIVEETSGAPEVQPTGDVADKPVESVEDVPKAEGAPEEQAAADGDNVGEAKDQAGSTAADTNEGSIAPQNEHERHSSDASLDAKENVESTSGLDGPGDSQNNMDGAGAGMFGNNAMMNMNGMPGQFGFGFTPNQGNFNGMGWNGMNGMPNMMGNGNWNNMNSMDFNNMNGMNGMSNMSNGMFGGFGGNMGMGMNDMSAMNMMNYGGGYGNGWNGMGGAGYGNFNRFNQMGGYNQSGAYPEMNQFPKNNFQNNRFNANGGVYPQRNNRKGSYGGYGPGSGFQHNANSRPGSQSGLQNRDGQSPDGIANAAAETMVEDEQAKASAEPVQEGKDHSDDVTESTTLPTAQAEEGAPSGDAPNNGDDLTGAAGEQTIDTAQTGGLNQIQTVESAEIDAQDYDQIMMNDDMQTGMQYPAAMMNQFPNHMSHINGQFNSNMGYGNNNYGPRGGFNTAYGAATVLTGEPRGMGVEGAPTGPRAMREGRPNTGFSSRINNARYNAQAPSATLAKEVTPASPVRRVRSQSPQRDDSLRTKDKSPSRSRSRSRGGDENKREQRERSYSIELEDRSQERGRSVTPKVDYDYERHQDRHHHHSSRYDDRDERDVREDDYDDRYRDDRDGRGDRTRSPSTESRHRSRRDKEKHRSSRSHRDRSREHRRRHRSRSRSPIVEERYEEDDVYVNGTDESSSRRKGRSDKEKYRERDRDRSRDRDRDRDRRDRKDRDYEYEKEKDRSRDKDKERRRRRERETDDDRDYDDDKYRSSRRSRKDRDRDRGRDYDRDDRGNEKEPSLATSTRPTSPPLNAPTGPSADSGFSIKGISKKKDTQQHMPPPQPPTGPRAFQPPKGPAADREKDRRDSRDHRRKSSMSSVPSTPTTPAVQDHYAAERERNARERSNFDRNSRDTSSQSRSASHHSRPQLSSKRSRDDFETLSAQDSTPQERPLKVPTGPSAHRDKRRKSGGEGNKIADLLTAGLRKNAGKRSDRRGGIKTEGDVERELERVERERDGRRW